MSEYIERDVVTKGIMAAKWMDGYDGAMAMEIAASVPATEAVSLHDIYRVIAGHSYYHGDAILAALSCIVEGKEVNPVRPVDVARVTRCKDCKHYDLGVCLKIYADGNMHTGAWQPRRPEDFCSYGKRKDDADG